MDIKEILDKILHAAYGRDVRQSLHDGVKIANDTADDVKVAQEKLEQKFDEQIKNMTSISPSDAEIVDARTDASGRVYDTLGKRLNLMDARAETIHHESDTALAILKSGKFLIRKEFTFIASESKRYSFDLTNECPEVSVNEEKYATKPIGVVGSYIPGNFSINAYLDSAKLESDGIERLLCEVIKPSDSVGVTTASVDILYMLVPYVIKA